jgi:hypothetical protein
MLLLWNRGPSLRQRLIHASRNLGLHLRNVHNTWSALRCQQGIIQRTPQKRRSLTHSPVRWSGLHLSKLIPFIPLSNARQAAFFSLSHKTNDHPKYKINLRYQI